MVKNNGNKKKGDWVEKVIRENYGLKKAHNLNGDALTKDDKIVEIKSAELITKNKTKKMGCIHTRYGRFMINPYMHKSLPRDSTYIFAVTFKGRVLFSISLPKSDVCELIDKYKSPAKKWKLLISEIVTKSNGYNDAIRFFLNPKTI